MRCAFGGLASAVRAAAANGRGLAPLLRRHAASLVRVPAMGDSITEGSVSKLVKAPGSTVAVDEVVVVIETDKVRLQAQQQR